jgi:hypothetical protein
MNLFIHFETTASAGNKYAQELQEYLSAKHIQSEQVKENDDTQDAGAILSIILGAGAVKIIAKGIADWLRKKPEATITLTRDKGKYQIIGKGLSSDDIEKILIASSLEKDL